MIQIDMDVPNSCGKCPFFQMIDSRAFCLAKKNIRGEVYEMNPHKVQGGRTEWCPISEKKEKDWWDILINKFIPVCAGMCFIMIIVLLLKLILK